MAGEEDQDEGPDEFVDGSGESMGEPVSALLGHALPASSDFRHRVRGSIFRRTLAGDLTRFATWGPFTALLELLRAVFESIGGSHHAPAPSESEDV